MSLSLLDFRRRANELYDVYRSTADPARAVAQWRSSRDDLLRAHPDGALLGRGPVPYARYDERARHLLEVDTDVEPLALELATAQDGNVALRRLGVLHVPSVGDLDVWWLDQYAGGIFVPLKDATSGTTSYGGGRYLLDTAKGADHGSEVDPVTGRGQLRLDLNLAYHPSCAYDARWSCPLAPPGNTVTSAVTAGERLPPGGWY